ncbi:MAG: NADH-quinone oxidoreductase subunit NuoE [Acidimicrobiia bacterium]|nr:NADH-quinone oxidoreductase subunit NuoE [Acidimicrobiia bacterium]
MARFSETTRVTAHEIISRYPVAKSAVIPLCHLAQEQDGWLSEEAMTHIAELVDCTPAEVLGTASFYEMLKLEPVGRYLVNVCTQLPCMLLGADELLAHAEETLGVLPGQTTPDGLFTLEGVECVAACTEAPCLQLNYRYFHRVSPGDLDQLVSELRATGRTTVPTKSNDTNDIPHHGTLARVRQHIPAEGRAGNAPPDVNIEPPWLADPAAPASGATTSGGS